MTSKYAAVILAIGSILSVNAQILFEDQSTLLGVDVALGDTFLGNGVSFYDFDNDGWDDLTITSSSTEVVRFFKNTNGTFVEQFFSGLNASYETKSVTWVDYDNDGDNDVLITSAVVGNKLFKNLGNMTFQDVTASSGLSTSNLYTYGASWGDYDRDGDLDVFLSNRTSVVTNKLYRNNGDGTFNDVTLQAGIDFNPSFSFCSAFVDINNDGYQDLYVANDKLNYQNKMYKNNGDGSFTDISESSGTNLFIDAMSVTVGDYNADGFFDIYVTNNPSGNVLLRNNGDETFTNVADEAGVAFNSFAWGASFFDADNDMDLDLYVSGQFDGSTPELLSAAFYDRKTTSLFQLNNSSIPGDDRESYANAIGDIDNDGLIDVVVINNNDQLFLWKNVTSNPLNWLKLKLIGTQSNKSGVGAKIEISSNGQKQYRYTFCGQGYIAQYGRNVHFGVGSHTVIDELKITWPSGNEDSFFNVTANQTLEIIEGASVLSNAEVVAKNSFIYPNPVDDILHIDTNRTLNTIKIINTLGQTVLAVAAHPSKFLNIGSLQAGHYTLVLEFDNGVAHKKIIKK